MCNTNWAIFVAYFLYFITSKESQSHSAANLGCFSGNCCTMEQVFCVCLLVCFFIRLCSWRLCAIHCSRYFRTHETKTKVWLKYWLAASNDSQMVNECRMVNLLCAADVHPPLNVNSRSFRCASPCLWNELPKKN